MYIFIIATLLPNIGFWFETWVYRENFTCWYKPPKSDLESMIETLMSTPVPELRRKAEEVRRKLNKTATRNDPALQAQLTRELNALNESLVENEKKAINLSAQMHESLVEHAKGIPQIFWLMSSVNIGLGSASYVMWDEYAFSPLVSYAFLLCLYWTFYPVLFEIGSKPLTTTQALLMSFAGGLTTALFWNRDIIAGILVIPFDLMLLYLSLEVSATSQEKADIRLFISNEIHDRGQR
ncbi:hypothetical protein GE061_009885 [Apolygus lucorum]|uniref:Uncharacterized protein n=1 Tax=Apolygus lucorum TaxID=248454 RepID=A0A8S9Y5M2_APOLU|nr:hypothetical protein GE061_009885 [Apolygus lucorum]